MIKYKKNLFDCFKHYILVSCSPCGRKFSSRKALASHKSYCAQKKKGNFLCTVLIYCKHVEAGRGMAQANSLDSAEWSVLTLGYLVKFTSRRRGSPICLLCYV